MASPDHSDLFPPETLAGIPLLTSAADRLAYGYDNSRLQQTPALVCLPESHHHVERIVSACHHARIPLVARGRGTGTTGAVVPGENWVVLSMEKMDQIIQIDPLNRYATVQPGLSNQCLQDALKPHGFFWPPDPTSAAFCSIGGNLAYNSAGPRAVKYGTPRENTLGLKAVTGTGQTLITGVKTTKGVVGYDLTRLLIGSEGTLAIITEATLKLSPLPEAVLGMRAAYSSVESAASAVSSIMAQPIIPCALEFMDGAALALAREHTDIALPEAASALLIIEVDGPQTQLKHSLEQLSKAGTNDGLVDLMVAETEADRQRLWSARKALSPSLRKIAPKKLNEDVVVPVSRLAELINGLSQLADEFAIQIVNFGHAGNGNIHVNLLYNPDDAVQRANSEACLARVFELVLQLDGTLSGEHGVGLCKRDYIAKELDPHALELMHAIKRQFDPNNILNPGKTLPNI